MYSSVKEELASPNPGQKKPQEVVGRGEGCYHILAHYSYSIAEKRLFSQNLLKIEPFYIIIMTCLHTQRTDKIIRQCGLDG
jgi:hypothetical protein